MRMNDGNQGSIDLDSARLNNSGSKLLELRLDSHASDEEEKENQYRLKFINYDLKGSRQLTQIKEDNEEEDDEENNAKSSVFMKSKN